MKILLISDATMNENAGGLSQTLYNILSWVKPADLLCLCSSRAYKESPPSSIFKHRYINYSFELIKTPKNRLAKYVQKSIAWLTYSINQQLRSFKSITTSIKNFDPEIVIVCPNGPEALFMYKKLEKNFNTKKVYPYFMDDWLYQTQHTWMGGSVQALAKEILSANKNWMMISNYLAEIFRNRYKINPDTVLEIHNPVSLKNIPAAYDFIAKDKYVIAYAGSLWPMHFDAFLKFAEAVHLLQKNRPVELILYTSLGHWNWRKHQLEPLNVNYGGNISYNKIHETLAAADCLLVTSSFSEEWITHSMGSIQTKVTDYLKAGRLIIGYGPGYSANNKFLQQHECGICIESNDSHDVKKALNNTLNDLPNSKKYITNGYRLLNTAFSFEKAKHTLLQFFNN